MTNHLQDEKTTSVSNVSEMGNGHKKTTLNSFSADDLSKHSEQFSNNRDVAKWSSNEVQHWVKQQCKRYELKKATAEKFEMNGKIDDFFSFSILNRYDFRRSFSIAE